MNKQITLSLTNTQYIDLQAHLFPGDNKEALSFALCGTRNGNDKTRIVLHKLIHVPYDKCPIRKFDRITWKTDILAPILDEAQKKKFTVLKIHSHPNTIESFSKVDDDSDIQFAKTVYTWVGHDDLPVLSAVMLPNRQLLTRCILPNFDFKYCSMVGIIGDDIVFQSFLNNNSSESIPAFAASHGQAFGAKTMEILKNLRIAVVGCSGLGSPVIEQLARLGVGELVLVDPDIIEERNLNRILNSTIDDAKNKTKKVMVMKRAIDAMGLGLKVITHDCDLENIDALKSVALCDVAFGCMDGLTGRHLLNKICTYYSIPFFDTGVKLEADQKGSVDQVVGTVHYFQPGMSSFFSRKVFSPQSLGDESIKKNDLEHYKMLLEQKYIKGVIEHRLAVISVNMLYASLAVNEFLARIHPYRLEENANFATHMLSLSHALYEHKRESESCQTLKDKTGLGDRIPLLDMPKYTENKA